MGGGRKFAYPKWVWSPSGGWWPTPANWKRNSAIYVVVALSFAALAASICEKKTVRFPKRVMHANYEMRGGWIPCCKHCCAVKFGLTFPSRLNCTENVHEEICNKGGRRARPSLTRFNHECLYCERDWSRTMGGIGQKTLQISGYIHAKDL
jgi:hypothetical protein